MKQHPFCTDPDHGPTILDLPIPEGLKMEWATLQTRRNFLGKVGKVLGWAALASLAGDKVLTRSANGSRRDLAIPWGSAAAAPLRAKGEAGDLPIPVRRPAANGHV